MKVRGKTALLALSVIMVLAITSCEAKKEAAPASQGTVQAAPKAVQENFVEKAALAHFAALPADNNMIGEAAFVEKLVAGEDMFILDIRQPDVYAAGHVKGAINVPWGSALGEALDTLPRDKTIYVYCYTGQTANQTVGALSVAGFTVKSVRFGWNLGIAKVEGYEKVVETSANMLPEPAGTFFEAGVKEAVVAYFDGLSKINDPIWANYKISEADTKKFIEEGRSDIVVLSVRSAADYEKGHLPTAINIPWGKGMQEQFGSLPKDKKIITYCYTGQTAGQVVAILRLLGYDAYSMNGGMGTPANAPHGWTNKGYEVVQ